MSEAKKIFNSGGKRLSGENRRKGMDEILRARRVNSDDCASRKVVFRDFMDVDKITTSGCGRWDCLPCSVKKAKQMIVYMVNATRDWPHLLMYTFTVRHEEPMDKEKHRLVLCHSFRSMWTSMTQSRNAFLGHQRTVRGDHSSALNGRYPNLRYIRILERHKNGYLHIHMLCDTFIPLTLLKEKWQAQVDHYAVKYGLLDNCPSDVVSKWNNLHEVLIEKKHYRNSPAFRNLQREHKFDVKDEIIYVRRNAYVHVLYPKMAKENTKTLHSYVNKMAEHEIVPKIRNTKEYKRTVIAMQVSSYLSKDLNRRQNAVELAQKYPYNRLHVLSCRFKVVESKKKWMDKNRTGLWKIIGYGEPGKDLTEFFYPTTSALADNLIPKELYEAIPRQVRENFDRILTANGPAGDRFRYQQDSNNMITQAEGEILRTLIEDEEFEEIGKYFDEDYIF